MVTEIYSSNSITLELKFPNYPLKERDLPMQWVKFCTVLLLKPN